MKRILAIILAVVLSAVCLTGCGFFEEGELDEGSIIFDTSTNTTNTTSTTSTKETNTAKSATVNTETAEINVEKVFLGDISQDEVDNINGRINWLIGYTNDLIDELKGDTKANKKEIAKHEEEYKKYAEELEKELAAINEKLTKDADDIGTIFERLDLQDFSIKKLANDVKIIFNTLSFYGKQLFNLDKNLKKETAERKWSDMWLAAKDQALAAKDQELAAKDTALEAKDKELEAANIALGNRVGTNENSITEIQGNVTQVQGDISNLSIDSSRFYASTADLQQQLNVLNEQIETLATIAALQTEGENRESKDADLYGCIISLENSVKALEERINTLERKHKR